MKTKSHDLPPVAEKAFVIVLEAILRTAAEAKRNPEMKRYMSPQSAIEAAIGFLRRNTPATHPVRQYTVQEFRSYLYHAMDPDVRARLIRYCEPLEFSGRPSLRKAETIVAREETEAPPRSRPKTKRSFAAKL